MGDVIVKQDEYYRFFGDLSNCDKKYVEQILMYDYSKINDNELPEETIHFNFDDCKQDGIDKVIYNFSKKDIDRLRLMNETSSLLFQDRVEKAKEFLKRTKSKERFDANTEFAVFDYELMKDKNYVHVINGKSDNLAYDPPSNFGMGEYVLEVDKYFQIVDFSIWDGVDYTFTPYNVRLNILRDYGIDIKVSQLQGITGGDIVLLRLVKDSMNNKIEFVHRPGARVLYCYGLVTEKSKNGKRSTTKLLLGVNNTVYFMVNGSAKINSLVNKTDRGLPNLQIVQSIKAEIERNNSYPEYVSEPVKMFILVNNKKIKLIPKPEEVLDSVLCSELTQHEIQQLLEPDRGSKRKNTENKMSVVKKTKL